MKTEHPLPLFARYPEFLVLTINMLVLRLGGCVTFSAEDLASMTLEYENATVAQDFEKEEVCLKLRTRKGEQHVLHA